MFRFLARTVVVSSATAMLVTGLAATPAAADTGTYSSSVIVPIGQTSEVGDGGGMIDIKDASATAVGAATPYPSVASINGLVGQVSKVVLHIKGFTHGYPTDVDMMLVAPSGERAWVMSDQGPIGSVSNVDLTFDDATAQELAWGAPLASGTYRPSDVAVYATDLGDVFPAPAPDRPASGSRGFAALNGANPNGAWSLYVTDDDEQAAGSIFSWSVTVTSTGSDRYPSTIDVAGAAGTVTDVDVHLEDFSHGYPEDVDLLLVGPQGQQATILSDIPQTNGIEDRDLTFDDTAPSNVRKPIVSGTFQPTNLGAGADIFPAPAPTADGSSALAVFNGTDPTGTWKLYAADDGPGGGGDIQGWSLDIASTGSPAPPPTGTPTPGSTPGAAGEADTVRPKVSSIHPAKVATGVRRGASVKATLSEAVRPSTVTRTSTYLVRTGSTKRVRATVTWEPGTRRIVIDPRRALRARTTYTALVTTAIRDLAGNRLDQNPTKAGLQNKTWRFTTR